MIQYGMTAEGMEMVKEIPQRYDGRHRGKGEVTLAIPEGQTISELQVTLDGRPLPHQAPQQNGPTTTIQLTDPVTLHANSTLNLRLSLSPETP